MSPIAVGGHLCILLVRMIICIQINRLNMWGMPASAGREDVVRYLVGADANVNAKNDKGLTPL
jgi:ankyrin repeat protein